MSCGFVRLFRSRGLVARAEGAGDGVECCQAVAGGGIEVAADAAPAGEGAGGVPVSGDGLVPLGGFDGLLGAVVRPVDGELRVNSHTCSL